MYCKKKSIKTPKKYLKKKKKKHLTVRKKMFLHYKT
jgi:hypothetical protein